MNIYLCGNAVYILSNLYLAKRERYGVKIYMLCESSTGYLWKIIIYTGADTVYPLPGVVLPKPFDEYGNPSKVVLSLLNGLITKVTKLC